MHPTGEEGLVCARCGGLVSQDESIRRWGIQFGRWNIRPRRITFHRHCLSGMLQNGWRDTGIFVAVVAAVIVVMVLVR